MVRTPRRIRRPTRVGCVVCAAIPVLMFAWCRYSMDIRSGEYHCDSAPSGLRVYGQDWEDEFTDDRAWEIHAEFPTRVVGGDVPVVSWAGFRLRRAWSGTSLTVFTNHDSSNVGALNEAAAQESEAAIRAGHWASSPDEVTVNWRGQPFVFTRTW